MDKPKVGMKTLSKLRILNAIPYDMLDKIIESWDNNVNGKYIQYVKLRIEYKDDTTAKYITVATTPD